MALKFESKGGFVFIIAALLLVDLAILLDVPAVRQIFGFLCFIIMPGFLILYALKLDKLGCTEKFILSLGLGISFLMLFGLFIDKLYFGLGYVTPLSTISLVVTFSAAMILFCIVGYKTNQEAFSFAIPDLNLNNSEKVFLSVPLLFPALSIFGMYVMNTTDNNIFLMFLLFLIPIYVAFVCFFNQKFPKRFYPVVIFSISISVLLLWSLRSNYIIGADMHTEYFYFRTTLGNLHWSVFGHSVLDACLAISLLPAICQSILNVNTQYLYKIFYPLAFSVSPLVIYIISKKYVGEFYGFLASMFFISQKNFFRASASPRTTLAALFFAIAMMILFSDKIDPLKKRILFITFMASCIVSHYSTAYAFFFIMLGVFTGIEMLSKKYTFKKVVSLTMVVLFFAFIFFWYSQVTEAAFDAGVSFFEQTFRNLNMFFIEEARCERTQTVLGAGIMQKGIPHQIEFVFMWLTFAFIGIGIIELIRRYKEMSFLGLKLKKPDFLKDKFDVLYFMFALVCAGLLVAVVALPYVSKGYSITRVYTNVITILSVFFVIGGVLIAKYLNQAFAVLRGILLTCQQSIRAKRIDDEEIEGAKSNLKKSAPKQMFKRNLNKNISLEKKVLPKTLFTSKKRLRKNISQQTFKKHFASESVNGRKASEVWTYLIILVVLIPYFLCVSGVMYNIFGVHHSIILNSKGELYDSSYSHDQESYAAKWIKRCTDEEAKIYTDRYSGSILISQGGIRSPIYAKSLIEDKKAIKEGYIYLGYANVVNGKLVDMGHNRHNLTEYSGIFSEKDKIYDNGGSEVWK